MVFNRFDETTPTCWVGEIIPSPNITKLILVFGGWFWKLPNVAISVDALILGKL
jgi:hypothetical protein